MNNACLAQFNHNNSENNFNLDLGSLLFSDPSRDRSSAVVVANHQDIAAGIEANDLVRVDFTANKIDGDGLYIITRKDEWIGYRYFQRSPDLRMSDGSNSTAVNADMLKDIKIVGKVKDIYRSAGMTGAVLPGIISEIGERQNER